MLRLPVLLAAALSTLALLAGCGQQQASSPAATDPAANVQPLLGTHTLPSQPGNLYALKSPSPEPSSSIDLTKLQALPPFVSNISIVATNNSNYGCPDIERKKGKRTADINSGHSTNHVYACIYYTSAPNTPHVTMLDVLDYGPTPSENIDNNRLRNDCANSRQRPGQTVNYSPVDLNKGAGLLSNFIYLCWYTGVTPTDSWYTRNNTGNSTWNILKYHHIYGIGDVPVSRFISDIDFVAFPHGEVFGDDEITKKCQEKLAPDSPTMLITVLGQGGLYSDPYYQGNSTFKNLNEGVLSTLDQVYACVAMSPVSALPTLDITVTGIQGNQDWFKGAQPPVAQVKIGNEFVYHIGNQPKCGINPPGYDRSMKLRPSTQIQPNVYLSTVQLDFNSSGEGSVYCHLDWPWYVASDEAHVKYDSAPPTVTFPNRHDSYTIDELVNITCTAYDEVSGVAQVSCPQLKGTAGELLAQAGIQPSQLPYTLTYTVKATDVAGNESSTPLTFTVQKPDAQSFTNLTNDLVPIVHVAARLSILSTYITYSWTPERKQALVNGYRQYLRDSMKQGVPQHAVDVLSFLIGYL
ncbi:hypothetical protein [Deinococcus apachensis]|uniref:hypothetical protein n=1 Tax=Deinococcus apachensis TaxID=309886 RepID=UPI001FE0064A|nr:hypothetical protein [Deinococcus apachensis]